MAKNLTIKFLGGAREVGRSAIEVRSEEACILLDYGVLLNKEPEFPSYISPKDIDAIVVSHAHLDHCGSIPMLYIDKKIPIYTTKLTLELMQLLISDFLKLSGHYLPYESVDLEKMSNSSILISYRKAMLFKDVEIEFLRSGHIPGSAQIVLRTKDSTILYTSDFNLSETRLLHRAENLEEEVDAVIIESTYADRDHEERTKIERRFISRLYEVMDRGGVVLVPAFSIGRSQEILMILEAYRFAYPVALDGMAKRASEILAKNYEFLKDSTSYMRAIRLAKWIEKHEDREKIIKIPHVIISPAGMLKGGPSTFYMHKLAMSERNAIFMVGYQVPNTPGRILLDTKRFPFKGEYRPIKAEVEYFDFSSHSGRSHLFSFLKRLKGSPKVFTVHGAGNNCEQFANEIKEEIGLEAIAPTLNEAYKV